MDENEKIKLKIFIRLLLYIYFKIKLKEKKDKGPDKKTQELNKKSLEDILMDVTDSMNNPDENNNLYKYLLDAITGNNSYENIDIPLEKTKKQNINSLIESIQEELNL